MLVYCVYSPAGRFYFAKIYTMERLTNYFRATLAEMKHVSWPTQWQAVIYSSLVIGISVAVALFIFVFDQLFTEILRIIGINF